MKNFNRKDLGGDEDKYPELMNYYRVRTSLDKEILKERMRKLGLDDGDENLEIVIMNLEPDIKLKEKLPDTYEHTYYVK
jgi:hypothetical protein